MELKNKSKDSYDFIMCRGNSFIYAPGGWNSKYYHKKKALQLYKETLNVFYEKLSPKGLIFIDKFRDDEVNHEEKVCKINVLGESYDLIFQTKLNFDKKERYATLFLDSEKNRKETFPNITYSLSEKELLKMAREVGFADIEKVHFRNEKLFDIFILRKN